MQCLLEIAREYPPLLGALAILVAGLGGHFPVIWFLRATKFFRPPTSGRPNFGKWIGILERFAIALLALQDALTGAAFIFAVKAGVMSLRVEKDGRQTDVVEYILVGTFASFLVAATVGLLARWLLQAPN